MCLVHWCRDDSDLKSSNSADVKWGQKWPNILLRDNVLCFQWITISYLKYKWFSTFIKKKPFQRYIQKELWKRCPRQNWSQGLHCWGQDTSFENNNNGIGVCMVTTYLPISSMTVVDIDAIFDFMGVWRSVWTSATLIMSQTLFLGNFVFAFRQIFPL